MSLRTINATHPVHTGSIELLRPPIEDKHGLAYDFDDTYAFTEDLALRTVCLNLNEHLQASGFAQFQLDADHFVETQAGSTHPAIMKSVRDQFGIDATAPGWTDAEIAAMDPVLTDKVIAEFRKGGLKLAPGMQELLEAITPEKIRFCVVSSSPIARLEACIEGLRHQAFNIPLYSGRLKSEGGSLDVGNPKPATDIYDVVTSAQPDDWISVEDSTKGMLAARNIIKRFGFVGCLSSSKQFERACDLFEAGALIVVADHRQVLEAFLLCNAGRFSEVLERFGPKRWQEAQGVPDWSAAA